MTHPADQATERPFFPRWWRWTMIASSVLILCSCRTAPLPPVTDGTLPMAGSGRPAVPQQAPQAHDPRVVPVAYHAAQPGPWGVNPACPTCPGGQAGFAGDLPGSGGGWAVAGTPWPGEIAGWQPGLDEYLCDGGDHGILANVRGDWEVHGLDIEDTIAHFDTLDGRTKVQPSNRTCVYAPKFNSVRRVSGANIHGVRNAVADLRLQAGPAPLEDYLGPRNVMLPEQTVREVGRLQATNAQVDQPALTTISENLPMLVGNRFAAYEDFQLIRRGVIEEAEGARLAINIENALVWQDDLPPVVLIDNQPAAVEIAVQRAQRVYTIDRPEGPQEMRLVKVAGTRTAKPGEIVEFTLRFDNTGFERIGNVTIIDNLTTRLEYVPDSAQMSVEGELFVEPNDAGSVTLRWELSDPLEPGEGGIIRFQTRVR